MNKNVMKLMVAGLACVVLCGTTLAAPRGGNHGPTPKNAPTHQKVVAPKAVHNHAPAHPPAKLAHHTKHVVVHHTPPPPPPVVVHHECDTGTGLGVVLGALVGGLLGAVL